MQSKSNRPFLKKGDMKKKPIFEKKTGERYGSKSEMKKHEKSESKAERKREYGSKKSK